MSSLMDELLTTELGPFALVPFEFMVEFTDPLVSGSRYESNSIGSTSLSGNNCLQIETRQK
jgi:hypothetical protein